MDVITSDPDPVGINCVESVFPTPALEARHANEAASPAAAMEKDCAASSDPHRGSQEMGAGQESEARDAGAASSSEASPRETAAERKPWSGWGWLGWCRNSNPKTSNIAHVDVDAFFASVEQVLNLRLRGKPVLVGRGCVASASYEAKFCGVRTAMSFREALRICPKAIVVPGQYEHYADFAERVRRILETYTPTVETAALDDFYLDFAGTERLYPDFPGTLRRLQIEILKRTGLSVSIGAARTKGWHRLHRGWSGHAGFAS